MRSHTNDTGRHPCGRSASWRGALRRHLALLLLVKFAALALLWALFFSPAHRTHVDGPAVAQRLMPEEGTHD